MAIIRSSKRRRIDHHLPKDVLLEIFHKLPIKSLQRFKSVSKEWCCDISDRFFIETNQTRRRGNHLRLIFSYSTEFFTVDHSDLIMNHHEGGKIVQFTPLKTPSLLSRASPFLLGSYNGLVAMLLNTGWIPANSTFVLWNPLTTKFISFTDNSHVMTWSNINSYNLYGLCHDDITDSYSSVMVSTSSSSTTLKVHVLNFKNGTLYSVPGFHDELDYDKKEVGTTVRGIPHWVGRYRDPQVVQRDILWWDMGEKRVRKMACPPLRQGQTAELVAVCGLGSLPGEKERQLCVTLQDRAQVCWYEVWVMKEYGNTETWSNVFVIQRGILRGVRSMNVFGFIEQNGEYLVDVDHVRVSELWGFNPENGGLRRIIDWGRRSAFDVIPNEPSLISPLPN